MHEGAQIGNDFAHRSADFGAENLAQSLDVLQMVRPPAPKFGQVAQQFFVVTLADANGDERRVESGQTRGLRRAIGRIEGFAVGQHQHAHSHAALLDARKLAVRRRHALRHARAARIIV